MILTHSSNTYLWSSYNISGTVPDTKAANFHNDPFIEPTSKWDQTTRLAVLSRTQNNSKYALLCKKIKAKNVLIEQNSRGCLHLLTRGDKVLSFFVSSTI